MGMGTAGTCRSSGVGRRWRGGETSCLNFEKTVDVDVGLRGDGESNQAVVGTRIETSGSWSRSRAFSTSEANSSMEKGIERVDAIEDSDENDDDGGNWEEKMSLPLAAVSFIHSRQKVIFPNWESDPPSRVADLWSGTRRRPLAARP